MFRKVGELPNPMSKLLLNLESWKILHCDLAYRWIVKIVDINKLYRVSK